jgi:dienelactone hydrolase
MAEVVTYHDGKTELAGHVYRPVGAVRASVAIFPTIMNRTPAVITKAEALAKAGYLAFICDFYGRNPHDFAEAQTLASDLRQHATVYRRRLAAGLATVRKLAPDLPQATIGFCMGGQAVLELARNSADLVLAASFHGLLNTDLPAQPGAVKARILVCHGDNDELVPREQVIQFWEEMDHSGANWHFHSYSGVKHGFTNPNAPPNGDMVAYDPSADRQSWSALLSLLDEVLG